MGGNPSERDFVRRECAPRLYIAGDLLPRKGNNLAADFSALPLIDACLQAVIAWHVLEHIPNDAGVFSEIRRCLAPRGKALVSVPIWPPTRITTFRDATAPRQRNEELYGHPDHVRACGMDYGLLQQCEGLSMQELRVAHMHAGTVQRHGLDTNHIVWCYERQ